MVALSAGAAAQSFVRISSTEITEGSRTYILHTVYPGETVYGICRAYDISESELLKLNPFISKGLQAGHQLKILKKKPAKSTPRQKETYIYHIVKEEETLYSIARSYGTSVQTLQTHNPDVVGTLYAGKILRVPQSEANQQPQPSVPEAVESAPPPAPANEAADFCYELYPSHDVINIALLLPFDVNGGDMQRSFEFAEFYEGVRIALERLRQQGAKIKLYVWDVAKDRIKQTLSHKSFENIHLIIGPVYPDAFAVAADYAQVHGIPIVSPLALIDSALRYNNYAFQTAIGDEDLTRMLLQHCLDDAQDANIVLVSPSAASQDPQRQRMYRRYLPNLSASVYQNRSKQLDSLRLSRLIREYETRPHSRQVQQINYQTGFLPRDNAETFLKALNKNEVNRVIIASDNEPLVSELMAALKAFSDYYGCYIVVYGMHKWRKFENIDLETFYHLNLHLAAPYFVDYYRENVVAFIKKYREQYRAEPSQMAFQGYDVAAYFASALYRFGARFEECLPALEVELMQSNYQFTPISYSFRANKGGFMIRYNPETMRIDAYK
jgi:LysM repeat protein/ABC-type branched-subunit amino acid transport system substrate-binding protein